MRKITAILMAAMVAGSAMAGGWAGDVTNSVTFTNTTATFVLTNSTGLQVDLACIFMQGRNLTNASFTLSQWGATLALPVTVTGTGNMTCSYIVPNSNIPWEKNGVLTLVGLINTNGTGFANVTNTIYTAIGNQVRP